MVSQVAAKRFTVDELQRMADVFDEDDRLELLDCEIIQMNPVGRRHVAMVNRLTRVLARVLGDRALISVQNPLVLDLAGQPPPDLVLPREIACSCSLVPPMRATPAERMFAATTR
jgi:Uma2 family endonuclease